MPERGEQHNSLEILNLIRKKMKDYEYKHQSGCHKYKFIPSALKWFICKQFNQLIQLLKPNKTSLKSTYEKSEVIFV